MTDLPTLRVPRPPVVRCDEEFVLTLRSVDRPSDIRRATLEDVRQVLAAAGYAVVSKVALRDTVEAMRESAALGVGDPAVDPLAACRDIAQDAINGLQLLGQHGAAQALAERLRAL